MSGIYIHIPFCKQACSYCDFYFLTKKELRAPFVEALLDEIKSFENHPSSQELIQTIYIGGGTPSLLTIDQLEQIFDQLHKTFRIDASEVTLEMNPDDVSADYLRQVQNLGVNRASMGVQSFDEDLLRFMHRAHTTAEAEMALEAIQKANFPSFTADLIYGNPGQSTESLQKDVHRLLGYNPSHVSAYSLTIEPKTRLGKQVKLGRIKPPEDEIVAEHFDLVRSELEKAGINQYEVSNYSKPGKEAVHNSNYWRHKNYIGLGPSAHSFYWENENEAKRWENRPDLTAYLKKEWESVRENEENLSLNDLAEERLMLGLRTKWGVSYRELEERYGYSFNQTQMNWLKDQAEQGMVTLTDTGIALTHKGLSIADYLIVDLITR